jgi:undecaprenyl diphosphate synthase
MNNPTNTPQHVAIIMDGNGRWAKARGLPRVAGHREGAKAVKQVIKAAGELGIKILTLYTFSTENWKRPKAEIDALFRMLEEYLDREAENLKKNGIKLSITGDPEGLPGNLGDKIKKVISATLDNDKLTLNLALNYGSRGEIIRACRKIAAEAARGRLKPEDIDEKLFEDNLYTAGMPDPDLMIRTSGEMRVSNFLLWQISYAEIYVTRKLWPDFTKADLKKAVEEYRKRQRRYGGF